MLSKADKQIEWDGSSASIGRAQSAADLAEQALVDAARSLDEAAWEEMYRRYAERIYAYLQFRLRDQHVAEDLTADVFVRALAGIEGYVWRGTPILAWLYRIAHNVAADYRKKAAREMQHRATDIPREIADGQDRVDAVDEQTDMLGAVRTLTEDQQQVIILRFYHEMSNVEVARAVGKSEGAVKALQSRALRSLRRVLAEQGDVMRSA